MRQDHRPLWAKRLHRRIEAAWVRYRIAPQLDSLGPHSQMMQPWHIRISGRAITLGKSTHVIAGADRPVSLTTWALEGEAGDKQGRITIGDYVLLCPGVRIDSGCEVTIADNCMLAAGVYITDADWHGLYDRTEVIGACAPVILADNVWIGDGVTICKGVNIGRNAVVGAGAVVTKDVAANTVVAGNPASEVKQLDPHEPITRRQDTLADHDTLQKQTDAIERYVHTPKTSWNWLRSWLWPGPKD